MDLLTQRRAMMMAQGTEPQYVTDGLIHWLDGINKGASDGSWVDLIGGHIYTNYGSVTPISNGFYFDGVDDRFYNNTFTTVTKPTTNTIEVVLSGAQLEDVASCLFAAYAANGSSNVKRLYVAMVRDTSLISLATTSNYPLYPFSSASNVKSIVSCPDGRCYVNGVLGESPSSLYCGYNGTGNRIGAGYWNTNRHFYKGNIHAIRIYDRSLTAEELAHNYALDLQRFNL